MVNSGRPLTSEGRPSSTISATTDREAATLDWVVSKKQGEHEMPSINQVNIMGNLGSDPELRLTPTKKAVCTMRIATNESWVDPQGDRQQRSEWHTVVVWGRQAENCAEYLKKGQPVHVSGRLQTRKWADANGVDRWSTEIVAQQVQFLAHNQGNRPPQPPPIEDEQPAQHAD